MWLSLLVVPLFWYLLLISLNQLRLGSFIFEYAIFIESISFLTKYIKLIGTTTLLILINFIFAIVIKNYIPVKAKKDKSYFKMKQIGLILLGLILILTLNLNFSDSSLNSEKNSTLIKVAVIQPNFQQDWNWRYEHSNKYLLEKNLELSNQATKLGAKIIVWPEYSVPKDLMKSSLSLEKVKNFSRNNKVNLIIGTTKRNEKNDLNIALFINSSGEVIGDSVFGIEDFFFYQDVPEHKVKTVSFYINNKEIKVGTIICYEEFYSRFAKNMKDSNADLLVVLSNNQRISGGIWLASLFSKQRAAENNLPLIRSVNTGISQIINQQGRVLNALEKDKEGIIVEDIYV